MLLPVFITLFAISMVAIGIGYLSREQLWTLGGITFIFYLAMILAGMTGSLQVKTGETETTTYTYTNSTLTSDVAVKVDDYTSITDVWTKRVGWLLAVISGFAWGFCFSNIQKERRARKEAML